MLSNRRKKSAPLTLATKQSPLPVIWYVSEGPTERSDFADMAYQPYFFATKEEAEAFMAEEASNPFCVLEGPFSLNTTTLDIF